MYSFIIEYLLSQNPTNDNYTVLLLHTQITFYSIATVVAVITMVFE